MLLYFIETTAKSAPSIQNIEAHGLGYAFNGKPTSRGVASGPSGQAGYILCDNVFCKTSQPEYNKATQVWRKIPKSTAWIGIVTGSTITPDQLERPELRPSHSVELLDGHKWNCPIAMKWDDAGSEFPRPLNALPTKPDLDDDGNWTLTGIQSQYQQLWKTACEFYNAKMGATLTEDERRAAFEFGNIMDSAIVSLSTNYRINKIESVVLGILDIQKSARVLDALIDWPTMQSWMKKKIEEEHAGSDSNNGPEDSTPDTAQPSPS